MFVIEDELHAEHHGEFESYKSAFLEIKRRSELPWNEEPNTAPCQSWKTCGRIYEIIEYDDKMTPWKEIERTPILEINAEETKWLINTDENKLAQPDGGEE